MLCTRSEEQEMQGEGMRTKSGQVSHAGREFSNTCSLKIRSRAGSQAYHTMSRPRRACPIPSPLPLHDLDMVWCVRTTRIGRGRRWTGAADGGRQALGEHAREYEKNDGDRLGRLRWDRPFRLSLTDLRFRDRVRAQQEMSQQTAEFLAGMTGMQTHPKQLGSSACVLLLCLFKGGRLIGLVMLPYGKDDPDPDIGQCSDRDGMAFAFIALPLVVVGCPRFTLCRLPSKLLKCVAQRFDTTQSAMSFGVHPALKQHRRGSPQSLQTACILVALPIIPDFGQQSRSQMLACAWQALKDLVVRMGQKKGLNLLVILSNLLDQWQQLTDQRQHQTRFGTRRHCISLQMGLVQPLKNAGRHCSRIGMTSRRKHFLYLLTRSCYRFQGRRIGLQELQGALLLQFCKQFQCDWVIHLKTGRKLIDQTSLRPDQGILVAGEQFQFCNLLTIGGEP